MKRRSSISVCRAITEICRRYGFAPSILIFHTGNIYIYIFCQSQFLRTRHVREIYRCFKCRSKSLCRKKKQFAYFAANWRVESEPKSLLRGALPKLGAWHYTTFPLRHALLHGGLCLKLDDTRGEYFTIKAICFSYYLTSLRRFTSAKKTDVFLSFLFKEYNN